MKIITNDPNFIALILIIYEIFLTGFTGDDVAHGRIVLYTVPFGWDFPPSGTGSPPPLWI